MKKKKQPVHCILLKVLWGFLVAYTIFSIFFIISLISGSSGNGVMVNAVFSMLGVLTGILVWVLFPKAFEPELTAMRIKKDLYVQDKTKAMQEEIASTDADIKHRSIKKKTRSVKQGLSVENCPHCGDKVDADENFCNKCGKPLVLTCEKCGTTNQAGDEFCRSCGQKLKK